MTVKRIVPVILALGLLGIGAPGRAAEYFVDARAENASDGNPGTREMPWKTISRAFAEIEPAAGPGDTVRVRGGEYREQVVIGRSGEKGRPILLEAYPNHLVSVISEGTVMKIAGDHVEIEGFSVTSGGETQPVVRFEPGTGGAARGMTVRGGRVGISLARRRDFTVEGNDISGSYDAGIAGSSVSGATISGNRVHRIGEYRANPLPAAPRLRGDGIRVSAYVDRWGAVGVIDTIERYSIPGEPGVEAALFSIRNPETGEPVKLDFMRAWQRNHGRGVVGRDADGTDPAPTLLMLYHEDRPGYLDATMVPGGSVEVPSGHFGFPLRSNPAWEGRPVSPDEEFGLFETGGTPLEELRKARGAFLYYRFPPGDRCRDIYIVGNEVEFCGRQGILLTNIENCLVRENRVSLVGATGIQLENLCRNFLVEGNETRNNSRFRSGETGIWVHGAWDTVVQDNVISGNSIGLWVVKSQRVLIRRNLVHDNRGQNVSGMRNERISEQFLARDRAKGFQVTGARFFPNPRAPWTGGPTTMVHNTFARNGTELVRFGAGGVAIGVYNSAGVEGNTFLNNIIVQNDSAGKGLAVMDPGAVLDGNIYHNLGGPFRVIFQEGPRRFHELEGPGVETTVYTVSTPAGLEAYRNERNVDLHSLVGEVAFVNALNDDFRLAGESAAIDRGVPLARAAGAGEGRVMVLDRVEPFSAGFFNSLGEQMAPGDTVMVAGSPARVVRVERESSSLVLDRDLAWEAGAPVSYTYSGRGPDSGAFERQER